MYKETREKKKDLEIVRMYYLIVILSLVLLACLVFLKVKFGMNNFIFVSNCVLFSIIIFSTIRTLIIAVKYGFPHY